MFQIIMLLIMLTMFTLLQTTLVTSSETIASLLIQRMRLNKVVLFVRHMPAKNAEAIELNVEIRIVFRSSN